jgi:hypothetical protein
MLRPETEQLTLAASCFDLLADTVARKEARSPLPFSR